MDDHASTPPLTFLAAGTVFILAIASLVTSIDDVDPKLPDRSPDAAARELLDLYVRPYGTATAWYAGSPASAPWSTGPSGSGTSSSTPSGSSSSSGSSTSSQSSTGTSSSTGSFTGDGCSGSADKNCRATNGCDNGNLDANRKECEGSGSTTTTTTSATTTTTSSSGGSSSPGTPATPPSGGGFLAGLSLRTGVLDPVRVQHLINGSSTLVDATDGYTSYVEAKQMLGYPADADFRLVFIKVRPMPTEVLTDFGETALGNGASRASAWFCWGSCDGTIVRVDAYVG